MAAEARAVFGVDGARAAAFEGGSAAEAEVDEGVAVGEAPADHRDGGVAAEWALDVELRGHALGAAAAHPVLAAKGPRHVPQERGVEADAAGFHWRARVPLRRRLCSGGVGTKKWAPRRSLLRTTSTRR